VAGYRTVGEPLLCLGDDSARTDLLLVSLDTKENSADR